MVPVITPVVNTKKVDTVLPIYTYQITIVSNFTIKWKRIETFKRGRLEEGMCNTILCNKPLAHN